MFGPVKNPYYYLVWYNSEEEVPAGIGAGTNVSFVAEFADHILNMKEFLPQQPQYVLAWWISTASSSEHGPRWCQHRTCRTYSQEPANSSSSSRTITSVAQEPTNSGKAATVSEPELRWVPKPNSDALSSVHAANRNACESNAIWSSASSAYEARQLWPASKSTRIYNAAGATTPWRWGTGFTSAVKLYSSSAVAGIPLACILPSFCISLAPFHSDLVERG